MMSSKQRYILLRATQRQQQQCFYFIKHAHDGRRNSCEIESDIVRQRARWFMKNLLLQNIKYVQRRSLLFVHRFLGDGVERQRMLLFGQRGSVGENRRYLWRICGPHVLKLLLPMHEPKTMRGKKKRATIHKHYYMRIKFSAAAFLLSPIYLFAIEGKTMLNFQHQQRH